MLLLDSMFSIVDESWNLFFIVSSRQTKARCVGNRIRNWLIVVKTSLHMMGFKFLIFQPSTWQMMILAINSFDPDREISADEFNIIANINSVTRSE